MTAPSESSGLALAAEFPPADIAGWRAAAAAALRRDDPDEALARLRSTTYDDIVIEPLYTGADAIDAPVRPARAGAWDIRQAVDATDPERVLEELECGSSSIWLSVPADGDTGELIERALRGVHLDLAPIVLDAGTNWPAAADALATLWDRLAVTPAAGGSLGADPYAVLLDSTESNGEVVDRQLDAAADWANRLAESGTEVRTVTIDGTRFHDAGASDGQELGATLAAAVATSRALAERGVTNPLAAIELRLAATADQFATIAKFRAARQLWARVGELADASEAAASTPIHAVTSMAMLTRYDPAVNMLRATVGCFAAGVGGADAVTVLPYDTLSGEAAVGELGRRLARNTQSVLALEAHLATVIDPAGGSWYVEQLTDELAGAAWAELQLIESDGGWSAATARASLAERIASVRRRRDDDIDRRRAAITGTSEFPNVSEPVPPATTDGPSAGDFAPRRWSEGFEGLRARVDAVAARTGSRPRVYLATLGAPADSTARVTFAKNLFAAGGLDSVEGPVEDFASSGTTTACVCSSNSRYDDVDDTGLSAVDGAVATLEAAGATRVYVAGRGDAVVAGGNAHAALADLLTHLEIP